MDAYEALKETFDDLFQQAVEEGCYTEDEAAELVESLDIYSLLQVVRHNATTVYSYITQGRQERSFNYRGEDLFRQKATLLYEETDQVTMEIVVATRTLELWLLEDMSLAVVSSISSKRCRQRCGHWTGPRETGRCFTRSSPFKKLSTTTWNASWQDCHGRNIPGKSGEIPNSALCGPLCGFGDRVGKRHQRDGFPAPLEACEPVVSESGGSGQPPR